MAKPLLQGGVTPAKFLALALTFGGNVLMLGAGRPRVTPDPLGLGAGLLSAASAAFYTLYSKRALARYHPQTVLFWALVFAALPWVFLHPPTLFLSRTWHPFEPPLFFLFAVFATVIPDSLYFRGLRDLTSSQAGLISTLEPVVAAFTAYLALGEQLTLAEAGGALLVLAGIALLRRDS